MLQYRIDLYVFYASVLQFYAVFRRIRICIFFMFSAHLSSIFSQDRRRISKYLHVKCVCKQRSKN